MSRSCVSDWRKNEVDDKYQVYSLRRHKKKFIQDLELRREEEKEAEQQRRQQEKEVEELHCKQDTAQLMSHVGTQIKDTQEVFLKVFAQHKIADENRRKAYASCRNSNKWCSRATSGLAESYPRFVLRNVCPTESTDEERRKEEIFPKTKTRRQRLYLNKDRKTETFLTK